MQPHLVVHDGVDKDGDAVLGENLLRGDLVGGGPHVDLLVDVDAGDDEEDTRTSSSSSKESPESKDYSTLILLITRGWELENIKNIFFSTWTTLTVMKRDRGRVRTIIRTEAIVKRIAQILGPSSHPGEDH